MEMSVSQKFVHDMALKHEWLKEAQKELVSTLDYIQLNFGEHAVHKVYSDIQDRVNQLLLFPNSGLRYKDIFYMGHEVRISHMKKSSIIYCHDEETVYILAFWNNRRDDSKMADTISLR